MPNKRQKYVFKSSQGRNFEKLTTKNVQLNKDNILLFQQNIEFKKYLANEKRLFTFKNNKSNYSDSLSNNTSQITTNNNITNSISTYHKFIKFEEKKVTEIYTDSFEREDSSQHDSIVYMKNIREYSNDINENTITASKDKKLLIIILKTIIIQVTIIKI